MLGGPAKIKGPIVNFRPFDATFIIKLLVFSF